MADLAPTKPSTDSDLPGVIAELPRRQFLDVSQGDAALSQMRNVSFEVNRLRAFSRLFAWFILILKFTLHTFSDLLFGRDNLTKRAAYLRRLFEQNGGAFIKLGLHLSTRLDYLPWIYCNELSCMIDRMPPFPVEQAITTIERSLQRPLASVFAAFDPQPILSSAIACSYQAILRSGDKVIVKVRRPGTGEEFMSNLQAFDWLMTLAEILTIFRPGFTQGMRNDMKELMLEELDFIQEARRQDAFRRAAAKTRKKFFSAPRVHLDLSGEEVVVNEFASGMWLWELLAALEQGNEKVLTQAREMNIDPKKVARRLLWVNSWSWEENLFFHTDPHPNNIIVGHNSVLYFISFTNTGSLSRSKRQAMRQMLYYAKERDPQNLARASLTLMEPLPPIDFLEFTQELESYNWQLVYALEASPESLSWQERTSAIQWIGMIRLARKYHIVFDIQVLRILRSTLLFESMAVRLHPKISYVRQYWKFNRYRAEEARRKVTHTLMDSLDGKSNEQFIIRLDRITNTLESLLSRTRHLLSIPTGNFNVLMSKWSYALLILVRFLAETAVFSALVGFLFYLNSAFLSHQLSSISTILHSVLTNPFYWTVLIILIYVNGRTILFRMDDTEV